MPRAALGEIHEGSFIGNALPNFFVALLLMQVFLIHWNIFPVMYFKYV